MSTRDIIDSATEDFWHLSESADNYLANIETNLHVACQKHCPKCQEPVSVSFWRNRTISAINTLRYLQAGSKQMYLETGAKYCALDFSQKAKYAHDTRCAPAHDQFWFSKTPRHEDPFFAPMNQILRLCDRAEGILKTSKTHWEVKQAFVLINNARANVGRVIGPLSALLDGVELMAGAKNRRAEGKYTDDGLPSRESIVSIPKAMTWFQRMEDWRDDAMNITHEVLTARK